MKVGVARGELPTHDLTALIGRVWGTFLGRCVRRFLRLSGIDRCMVLASQAFTALIPLLILVSTLAPAGDEDVVARGIIKKFGLSGDAAASVHQLFDVTSGERTGLSTFSAVLLLYSGVSFTRRMQGMYRETWGEEKPGARGGLLAGLGLVALLAESVALYTIRALVERLPLSWLLSVPLSLVTGLVLWTSIPYLLLNRQVHWRRLLVGGAVTSIGTTIYGLATAVYMPTLVERKLDEFGLFGITIAIIGWLLAVSGVVVASAMVGAEFDESRAGWALRLKAKYGLQDPSLVPPEPLEDRSLNVEDLRLFLRVLVNWLVMAAAVWIATLIVPGVEVSGGIVTYLAVSLILGLVNAVVGPLLRLVALPLTIFTVGLSALAVNTVLLSVTALLSPDLDLAGPFGAIASAVVLSVVVSVVVTVLELVWRPMAPRT